LERSFSEGILTKELKTKTNMTRIYFIRHAQPDENWKDDRTRPLTPIGLNDRQAVTNLFANIRIDKFISSPYKRSLDTISECANYFNMEITTDERLRERKSGIKTTENLLEKRWNDFNFCEEEGENLGSVQQRNIEAIKEILQLYANKNIIVGTHGTALSTIMNYYDSSCGCIWFRKIWFCMPYVIRFDFEDQHFLRSEELLNIERGY